MEILKLNNFKFMRNKTSALGVQTLQNISKRTLNLINIKTRIQKTKKVWDILKNLGLDKIWTWKSNLSVSHDNLLYK